MLNKMKKINVIYILLNLFTTILCVREEIVQVVLLARNKAHTLPYFLTIFENLNYPKEHISLFIRSDHNHDNTISILESWLEVHELEYHSVNQLLDETTHQYFEGDNGISWSSDERNFNMIHFKEEGLQIAREKLFSYVWFLDLDVFLTDSDVLRKLIIENQPVVAPMLKSNRYYSNFWSAMSENMWFLLTDEYYDIYFDKKIGCFPVPLVSSCVLVNFKINATQDLTFNPQNMAGYAGPIVDTITFAESAKKLNINMHICNKERYGYIMSPLKEGQDFEDDFENLAELKIQISIKATAVSVSPHLSKFIPQLEVDNLGFDQIYLINLARNPDRKERMLTRLREEGLEAQLVVAVDCMDFNDTYPMSLGVRYNNITHPHTDGYAANYLSHYYIWQDVVEKQYQKVLILEDDVGFSHKFRKYTKLMLDEVEELGLEYEFIYIDRQEKWPHLDAKVENSSYLVKPAFSYSAACYVLSLAGAKKLVERTDFSNMVPSDIYFAILYDSFENEDVKNLYKTRDLKAYSIQPIVAHQYFCTYMDGQESEMISAPNRIWLYSEAEENEALRLQEAMGVESRIEL